MSFPGDDLDAMDEAMNGMKRHWLIADQALDRPIYGLRRLLATTDLLLPNSPAIWLPANFVMQLGFS